VEDGSFNSNPTIYMFGCLIINNLLVMMM